MKIHYYKQLDKIDDQTIKKMEAYVSKERLEKAKTYRFKSDRIISLISYVLLRNLLKENYNIDLNKLKLIYNQNNKPYIKECPNIHFNISHCSSGVCCAISDQEIGIDIENRAEIDWKIVDFIYTQNEKGFLQNSKEQNTDFIKIWTLKESYIKKEGLSIANKDEILEILPLEKRILIKDLVFEINEDEKFIMTSCRKNTDLEYEIKEMNYKEIVMKL
ncbi:MAG: 4'-phosphopantetheinyl transferase family protein [Mycoplasmatales bacterium]